MRDLKRTRRLPAIVQKARGASGSTRAGVDRSVVRRMRGIPGPYGCLSTITTERGRPRPSLRREAMTRSRRTRYQRSAPQKPTAAERRRARADERGAGFLPTRVAAPRGGLALFVHGVLRFPFRLIATALKPIAQVIFSIFFLIQHPQLKWLLRLVLRSRLVRNYIRPVLQGTVDRIYRPYFEFLRGLPPLSGNTQHCDPARRAGTSQALRHDPGRGAPEDRADTVAFPACPQLRAHRLRPGRRSDRKAARSGSSAGFMP